MTNPIPDWDQQPHNDNEFVMNLVDANERMGEAQVKIAIAVGVPAPYGVDQIIEKIQKHRAALVALRRLVSSLMTDDCTIQDLEELLEGAPPIDRKFYEALIEGRKVIEQHEF
jgi:hypothetical protein